MLVRECGFLRKGVCTCLLTRRCLLTPHDFERGSPFEQVASGSRPFVSPCYLLATRICNGSPQLEDVSAHHLPRASGLWSRTIMLEGKFLRDPCAHVITATPAHPRALANGKGSDAGQEQVKGRLNVSER